MENDLKTLNDLNWSYRAARVLHVANNIALFDILSAGPLSAKQVSQECKSESQMTEKLLIACAALGLIEKTGTLFKNSALAERYLVKGRPLYQGNIIAHSSNVWNFWTDLEDKLRATAAAGEKLDFDHRNFILGMRNIAVAGRAEIFINNFDLSGRKKLFDLGGGPGTYSIAACKKYPELRAVVFDLPETIAITKEIIAAEAMTDKVTVCRGSWETEDFDKGNDVVLLSNILHGQASAAEMKLSKAYDSMDAEGLLIIQEFLLNDDKTGPLIPALFNVMVGAYSKKELFSIIKKAGFENPEIVTESTDIGCTWIKAEKPKSNN